MLALLLPLVIAQSAGPAPGDGIAVLISRRTGLSREASQKVGSRVSAVLVRGGVPVVSTVDADRKLAELAVKDTAACDRKANCLSRLGALLGAGRVVAVDAAAAGRELAVNLELLSAEGVRLNQQSIVVALEADDQAFQAELEPFLAAVKAAPATLQPTASPPLAQSPPAPAAAPAAGGREASHAPRAAPPAASAEASANWRSHAWLPAVAGGVLLAGGGVLFGLSKATADSLSKPGLGDSAAASRAASTGSAEQTAGVALIGAGLAGLVVAGSFYALGEPPPDATGVSVVSAPGSLFVSLHGTFR